MAFQFMQIIQIGIYVLLGVLAWKIKNKKAKLILIVLTIALFLVNPVRWKQEGMSKIERRSSKINMVLPDRIIVEQSSFEKKQQIEMNKLKSQSKEIIKNEIN